MNSNNRLSNSKAEFPSSSVMTAMNSTQASLQSKKIVHDQVNRSPSKQMFSFSKQERFASTRRSYCDTPSYQLKSMLNLRSTNLGFGNKSDFTKGDSNKPGPDRYTMSSAFQKNKEFRRGTTFSLGRDEIKFRSIVTEKPTPGVGKYSIDPDSLRKSQIYSMGVKTSAPNFLFSNRTNPGPAHYNLNGMSKTGFYFYSKYSDSKASVFSPASSKRFDDLRKSGLLPGPGSYNQEGIQPEGRYINSKLQSAAGGRFSQEPRTPQNLPRNAANPGPGYYRVVSEFGDTEFPPIDTLSERRLARQQSSLSVPSFSRKPTLQKTLEAQQGNNTTTHKKSQSNFYQGFSPNHKSHTTSSQNQ